MTTRTQRPLAEQLRTIEAFSSMQDARMAAARAGDRCPECGEMEEIEDNGSTGNHRVFRCTTCNSQWDTTIGADG